ncbi:hypothetical protein QBC38DRAFT_459173 [Podospora fimiseda]|uniref:SRR1-like domain-containing protein n=1 Tax=Podospora fimiseda TaxID=252190 RepID=A0AAN7GP14_9PEZI|nr:hypothetical protein QBC38DRAFT_459173 [Podospora fimiseda]
MEHQDQDTDMIDRQPDETPDGNDPKKVTPAGPDTTHDPECPEYSKHNFTSSGCFQTILGTLTKLTPPGGWPIKKAIVFGTGSLTKGRPAALRTAALQIHTFIYLINTVTARLSERPPPRQSHAHHLIPAFAQDPMYTETDMEILNQLGIEVLEDPDGQDGIDYHTLAYSAWTPVTVMVDMLTPVDSPAPCFYYGIPVDNLIDFWISDPLCKEALDEFEDETRFKFIKVMRSHTLHNLPQECEGLDKDKKCHLCQPCDICMRFHIDKKLLTLEQRDMFE